MEKIDLAALTAPCSCGREHKISLKEVERREIQRAIAQYGTTTQGKRMAAKELGIGLATLYRKLEELGI